VANSFEIVTGDTTKLVEVVVGMASESDEPAAAIMLVNPALQDGFSHQTLKVTDKMNFLAKRGSVVRREE
jgi:hypothetical protein